LSQLALPLQLADYAVFDSYWPAGNETLLAYLRDLAEAGDGPGCWLWGELASGKTHLLQAVCERLGDRASYLPMALLKDAGPMVLEGAGNRAFVCIDDAGQVAGQSDWELALFKLYNEVVDAGGTIIVASDSSVRESGFELPDLRSRFAQLTTFQMRPLDDDGRMRALQLRAQHRGLELPDETARFMLNRSRRDMASLYDLLDRLDAEALRAKRRLTVPFVRDVLRS